MAADRPCAALARALEADNNTDIRICGLSIERGVDRAGNGRVAFLSVAASRDLLRYGTLEPAFDLVLPRCRSRPRPA